MRLVLPFGFYGAGNTGDEATLNGFAQLLSSAAEPVTVWSGSRNPSHTSKAEPRFRYFWTQRRDPCRWYAKLRADAYAVAGGTPIQDVLDDWPFSELAPHVRSIDRRRLPFAFIGVGVEDLRREQSRRIVEEVFAPRVLHWSVRSERGRQRLVEYGVPSERTSVAADMAWLINPVTRDFGESRLKQWGLDLARPVIGVNLANENSIFDRAPELARMFAAALDTLAAEQDAQLLFLRADVRESSEFDKAAALKVIPCLADQRSVFLAPDEYLSPPQLMSIIACCAATLSMRYHFCLFSALQGVPFIGIQRTDKVLDLCLDLQWSALVAPKDMTVDQIVHHGRQLVRHRTPLLSALAARIAAMRERAGLNLRAIHLLRTA